MPRLPSEVMFMNETGWPVYSKYGSPTFPCSSSNNEVASSVSWNRFFPLIPSSTASYLRARRAFRRGRMKEQSKTGGESSYRIVCRWVPLRLHLRRTSTFCTALKADGIRTLCRGGESAVSIALISILFLITREFLDCTILVSLPFRKYNYSKSHKIFLLSI